LFDSFCEKGYNKLIITYENGHWIIKEKKQPWNE
jgi:hypothetical protein